MLSIIVSPLVSRSVSVPIIEFIVGLPDTLLQATELALDAVAALPEMLIPQVPLAPPPVFVGA